MSSNIQPVAILTEQVLTTIILWEWDVDHVVGVPAIAPVEYEGENRATSVTVGAGPSEFPSTGDCVLVCGPNDCDYLTAVTGLTTKEDGLGVSETVAKEILGDSTSKNATWEAVPQEECLASKEQKKLLKRQQWYPDTYTGPEYDYYTLPYGDPYGYNPEEDPELPLDYYYEPRDYDQFHKIKGELPERPNRAVSPQTQQSNRSVKISNDNSGNLDEESPIKGSAKFEEALTDPPRRTIGPPAPGTKQNLNKGSTRRYPLGSPQRLPKGRQSSKSESYSNDPVIALHNAQTQQAPEENSSQSGTDGRPSVDALVNVGAPPPQQHQPAADQDPSAPRIRKVEHPDGSIEYSFGVVSGEVSVYNEGDTIRKPAQKHKSVISSLKSSLGIDDDLNRAAGWTRRRAKRSLIPENKPSAKNAEGEVGADQLKSRIQANRSPGQKVGFLKENANKNVPVKPANKPAAAVTAAPAPASSQPQQSSIPQQKPEQQNGDTQQQQAKDDAEAEKAKKEAEQERLEYERLRRLSLKQFYRDQAKKSDSPQMQQNTDSNNDDGYDDDVAAVEISRNKWAEAKITEEARRVAAENARSRREEEVSRNANGK